LLIVGIFYDHLEYFMAIWYNLWPFGTVCGHLLYFPNLVCFDQVKSGNPVNVTGKARRHVLNVPRLSIIHVQESSSKSRHLIGSSATGKILSGVNS
jgi:hypothetical protein